MSLETEEAEPITTATQAALSSATNHDKQLICELLCRFIRIHFQLPNDSDWGHRCVKYAWILCA